MPTTATGCRHTTCGACPQQQQGRRRRHAPALLRASLLALALLLLLLPAAARACSGGGGDHHDGPSSSSSSAAAATTMTTTITTTTATTATTPTPSSPWWPDAVAAATKRRLLATAAAGQDEAAQHHPWERPLGVDRHGRRRSLLTGTLRRCGTHAPEPAVRQRLERAIAVRQAREAAFVPAAAAALKTAAAPPPRKGAGGATPTPTPTPARRARESAYVPSDGGGGEGGGSGGGSGGAAGNEEPRTIEVPTYVTVVVRDSDPVLATGLVSDAAVQAQLDTLNRAYGTTPGSPVRWVFALKNGIARVKAGGGSMCDQKVEARIKKSRQGGPGALNLYIADLSECGLLGFSTWPWDLSSAASKGGEADDGVVIHYDTLPGGNYKPYDMGFTSVHEIGHWFGLYHTFQNGCTGSGDSVDDTPYVATPTEGCPKARDTCSQPGSDPVSNPMDYTDDACMETFSVGQQQRMEMLYKMWRMKD